MIYLGVEYGAVYHLEGPNGQKAVFNDPTDPDFVGILDPESSGLDAPEIREDSNDRVESDGAIFGDFFSGKRPIVLQGRIIAKTLAQRNERVGKLRAASNAKTEDATLWWEDAKAGKVFVSVRRQQPLRVTKGWLKEFQLALVSADSRILTYTPKTVTDIGIALNAQEKLPTVAGQITGSGPPAVWSNVNNIKASDNVYATAFATAAQLAEWGGQFLSQLVYGNTYKFSIPSTAIIIGVEVKPEWKSNVANSTEASSIVINKNIASATSIQEDLIGGPGEGLYGGAKNLGNDFPIGTFLKTADATTIFGGVTDRWRYAKYLTPTIVNSSAFGAAIAVRYLKESTTSVDALPVKVTYAEPLEVKVTNEGDAPSPAVIKIIGPLKDFYVLNQTTGEILTYTGLVPAGNEIWFDTENITVTEFDEFKNPINRFANVGLPNDWIQIRPGENKILAAGTEGISLTKLIVEYRDAWE